MDLTLLGPFEVGGPAGPVPFGATKERLLVALLALRANEVVSSAQLIDGLWGEDPPATALKTVHGHVARARRILTTAGIPDAIVTRDPGYLLRVEPDQIDAVCFERHARAGRRALAEGDVGAAEHELAAALARWRGDALGDCRQESEVVAAGAVRLDELRLNAVEDHIDALLALGRHAEVVGDLEALVARSPLRERLWCALMLALYRSQRQADALRAYQRARAALIEDGVEPSAALRALEDAILHGDERLDLAAPRRSAAAPDRRPPPSSARLVGLTTSGPTFVGRHPELAALTESWERSRAGDAQMVMISGEPGIGKTRLAAEIAVHADREGARVLYGRCDEDLGMPYQPFVEALRAWVASQPNADLLDSLGRYPGELVRLVPELAQRVTDLEPPLLSDPATEQYRLFEAVVGWLSAASDTAPIVLLLDDVHWAAQPTVLLLRHVIRAERVGRLLLLATYRHSELDATHPLAKMLADSHVSAPVRRLERVELHGLDAPAVAAFVETASGRDLGEDGHRFAQAVHVETAGNPFFVNEIVRSLIESGELETQPVDAEEPAAAWPGDVRIPSAANEVVLRRITRLPDDVRHVLTLAAIVGTEFEIAVLEELAELDADAVLQALEAAVVARLIDEAGPDRFSFAHAITRGALYDRISASRRVRLHGRVGDAIEQVHAVDLGAHLSELAYHYADSNPLKAVPYAIEAAAEALDRLAFDDALTICRRGIGALELARRTGVAVEPTAECDLLLALGKAELRAGRRGRKTLLRAYGFARELGDAPREAAAVLAMNRGFFARIGRTDDELVDALEHAIAAQSAGDTRELAELLATLASELVWAPDGERRFELGDRALAMARRVGDPRNLARVLLLRNMTIAAPDTLDERVALFRELFEIANRLGDPALSFDSAFASTSTAWEAGDVPAINAMQEMASSLATELRQPRLEWQASFMLTARLLLEGALDDAEALSIETLELGKRAGQDAEANMFHNEQILEIRRWQGRLGEIVGAFRDLAGTEDFDFGYSLTRYLYDGDEIEAARGAYSTGIARLTLPPRRDMLAVTTLYNLAYLAVRLADNDSAPMIYDALLPRASAFTTTTVPKPVGDHFLAMLAATSGHAERAARHFEAATRAHQRVGAPLLLAETHLEHARFLAATASEPHTVACLLDSVRAIAEPRGAGFLQRGCDEVEASAH